MEVQPYYAFGHGFTCVDDDRFLDICASLPYVSRWPVAGIDAIRPSVRCVSYCGRLRVNGRSELWSRLSGPKAIRP